MEIERKFLINRRPENLEQYPCQKIEQAYLCTDPVVRIRRQDNDYILTYKSKGFLAREEYNLPLHEKAYLHLREKADGIILSKTRYRIPEESGLTIELDLFDSPYEDLILAEVEFPSEEDARAFSPPSWFGEEVTYSPLYHNSTLSSLSQPQKG
ncbi:MAG: CYTH domain-containing protein [Ruminococcus sp.]